MRLLFGLILFGLVSCSPPSATIGSSGTPAPQAPPAASTGSQEVPQWTPRPALPNQCRPNGCGPSGFFGKEVLDELAGCPFLAACNIHDTCYSRCDPDCKVNQDAKYCLQPKSVRRLACDRRFRTDLEKLAGSRPICAVAGEAYAQTVEAFGQNYIRFNLPSAPDKNEANTRMTIAEQQRIAADFKRRFDRLKSSSPGNR